MRATAGGGAAGPGDLASFFRPKGRSLLAFELAFFLPSSFFFCFVSQKVGNPDGLWARS